MAEICQVFQHDRTFEEEDRPRGGNSIGNNDNCYLPGGRGWSKTLKPR